MLRVLTSAVVAAILAVSAGGQASAQAQIKVGFTPSGAVTAFVAQEQGFFESRGLDVELVLVPINSTVPAMLVSGGLQFAAITPTVFLQAADNQLALRAVAGLTSVNPEIADVSLVAEPAAGVTDAASLRGKRVATPGLGAILHVLARAWLTNHGVNPAEVTFVEAAFPTHGDLMRAGTVDAAISVDPFRARLMQAGAVEVANLLEGLPAGATTQFFAADGAFVEGNPDVMASFVAALEEAEAFIATNPDEAKSAIGRALALPPEAFPGIQIPNVDTAIAADQLDYWVGVMKSQDMLQGEIDSAALIAR